MHPWSSVSGCAAWANVTARAPQQDWNGHEGMGDTNSKGPSMAMMAGNCHVYMTSLRPKQPSDEQKAKAVAAKLKAAIERCKDYRKALLDGCVIANLKLKQPQYHFINDANTREADIHFDPPTALL
jgi:hypothetical protein